MILSNIRFNVIHRVIWLKDVCSLCLFLCPVQLAKLSTLQQNDDLKPFSIRNQKHSRERTDPLQQLFDGDNTIYHRRLVICLSCLTSAISVSHMMIVRDRWMTRRASHERHVEPPIDHIRAFILGSRTFTPKLDFEVKYMGQYIYCKKTNYTTS